jgi:DNA-binding CsgD family transcriptional regulator
VVETLTDKERQIVDSVARGRTNREVAGELKLSHKTVEWTLTRVYRKLGVRSRTELVLLLVKHGSGREPGFPPGPHEAGI